MPFGLSNYGGSMGIIDDPIEDKDALLSPGQPTGKKGGFDWKKMATIGIAAPVVAALVSRMSGPRGGVSFGDAMGMLGSGFLQGKLEQQKEKRAAEMRENEKMLDLAHKKVLDLKNMSEETLAAYPKLQQLASKYQEYLINDGKLNPKEAAEIVRLHSLASGDMETAGYGQEQKRRKDQIAQDFEQKESLQRNSEVRELQNILGGGQMSRPEEGIDEADLGGLAGEMIRDQKLAQYERETPQPFTLEGQQFMGTPSERLRAFSEEQQKRHQMELERLRQSGMNNQLSKQQELADYQYAQNRWKASLDALLAGVDKDDLDTRGRITQAFAGKMPRRGVPFNDAEFETFVQGVQNPPQWQPGPRHPMAPPPFGGFKPGGPVPLGGKPVPQATPTSIPAPNQYHQRTKPRWGNITVVESQ